MAIQRKIEPKAAGDPILAEDWNALAGAVLEIVNDGRLRLGDDGTDTDPIVIHRYKVQDNQSDLRVIIGDDPQFEAGADRFVVGATSGYFGAGGGEFQEKFFVTSMGNAMLAGGLTIKGALNFWDQTHNQDSDPLSIQRVRRSSDANDLRIVIGDNPTDDGFGDRLVVGPVSGGSPRTVRRGKQRSRCDWW